MSEFGHAFGCIEDMHFDSWGVGPFVIAAGDQEWRFEDSDRFGPSMVNARGDTLSKTWPERSPFWRAHRVWVRQGRRLEADGITCAWNEPLPMVVRRINKRNALIIRNGEEDGKIIFEGETP